MEPLKLVNLPKSFPLDTPLEQNERFIKWKGSVSKKDVIGLFINCMHDKKVMFHAMSDGKINLPPTVYANLQYLARISGYSVDLLVAARTIASEEKYTAVVTMPQKLPVRERDSIGLHGNRNHFARYDCNYNNE